VGLSTPLSAVGRAELSLRVTSRIIILPRTMIVQYFPVPSFEYCNPPERQPVPHSCDERIRHFQGPKGCPRLTLENERAAHPLTIVEECLDPILVGLDLSP